MVTMVWPLAPCYFVQFLFPYIQMDIKALSSLFLYPLSILHILSISSSITSAGSNKQHRHHELETIYPFYRSKYGQDSYARMPFSTHVSFFSSSFLRIICFCCHYGENKSQEWKSIMNITPLYRNSYIRSVIFRCHQKQI